LYSKLNFVISHSKITSALQEHIDVDWKPPALESSGSAH
jgi:hypothetical protein